MKYIRSMFLQYLLGSSIVNWVKLLAENKFRIGLKSIPKALFVTLAIIVLLPATLLEAIIFGRRVKNTKLPEDPIFVLGHWRSGTTYMINLMSRHSRFAYFKILDIYYPHIFLIFTPILRFISRIIMPKTRPMDNIKLDLDFPQEEEYAIANATSRSFYHMTVFPKKRYHYLKYCMFEALNAKELKQWEKTYAHLLKKVTFRSGGKPLLLKNPTNTSRIKALLKVFPNAKFIHIYRNPYEVCLSSLRMYNTLFPLYSLQGNADRDMVENFQLEIYENLYRRYFEEKDLIPAANLVEIRYEDFIQSPVEHMEQIYQRLDIPGFEEAKPDFVTYIKSQKDYKVNEHKMNDQLKQKIATRCKPMFEKFGYDI